MLAEKADTVAFSPASVSPAAVALARLADHLNAVLRHGEALRAIERPVAIAAFDGPGVPAMMRRNRQIEVVVREAHALELAIVLRLTQAQVTAREAKRHAPAAASLLQLVATAAELVTGDVSTVPGASAFFASRGISAGTDGATAVTSLGEAYLLAARTPLGVVMDSAAAALDLLDALGFGEPAQGAPEQADSAATA